MKKSIILIIVFLMIGAMLSSTPKKNDDIIVITHTGYTTHYNPKTKIPDLVTYELVKSELTNDVISRTDEFLPDPEIKNCPVSSDYSKSGYDRGHMAPAADMKWSVRAMKESFYMSNVCPQHPKLNRGRWLKLEDVTRKIARKNDTVWICCGPIVNPGYKTIGRHNVAVPDSFYKCILWKEKNRFFTTGFIMKNEKCDGHLVRYMRTVDQIEQIIGYDLFGFLPDNIENRIESGKDNEYVYELIEEYEKSRN